MLYEFLDFFLM
uniref:Uncharacterized protein n=1 Tax=Rhizophora mucronata TaxID=61149 RepID=A0A2P2LZ06_RHIMU